MQFRISFWWRIWPGHVEGLSLTYYHLLYLHQIFSPTTLPSLMNSQAKGLLEDNFKQVLWSWPLSKRSYIGLGHTTVPCLVNIKLSRQQMMTNIMTLTFDHMIWRSISFIYMYSKWATIFLTWVNVNKEKGKQDIDMGQHLT